MSSFVDRLLRLAFSPPVVSRDRALAVAEGLSAVTHLISSLEFLASERDRTRGGLNNWQVDRESREIRSRAGRRVLDFVANRRVTKALYVARAVAAASLLAPLPRRARLAADAFLGASAVAMRHLHRYGMDGSDHMSNLVQTVAAVARAGQRRPRVVDACLWYLAAQSVLSYTASGWVKVTNPTWRSGRAITGVLRTVSFGDRTAWELAQRYPRIARVLGSGVLGLECLFPLVFVARGRLAPAFLGAAASFHMVNARYMGLGRFVWAWIASHAAILYAVGPRVRPAGAGRSDRRDDTFPAALAVGGLALAAAGAAVRRRDRRIVLTGRADEQKLVTSAGNTLSLRRIGPRESTAPLLVCENGLTATAPYWEWIAAELAERFPVVTYDRAGYGTSTYAGSGRYRLDTAVGDLVDLVSEMSGGRPAVLVGHSLGGYLAMRAAARLRGKVRGLVLVDSSHPGELERSKPQSEGAEKLAATLRMTAASLSVGLGPLVKVPRPVLSLPGSVRGLVVAQQRDPAMWVAGHREWLAVLEEFASSEGRLPPIQVPVLAITAGHGHDKMHRELQDEIAAAAPRAEQHVVDRADHMGLLSEPGPARRVAGLVTAFVDDLAIEDPAGETGRTDAYPVRAS